MSKPKKKPPVAQSPKTFLSRLEPELGMGLLDRLPEKANGAPAGILARGPQMPALSIMAGASLPEEEVAATRAANPLSPSEEEQMAGRNLFSTYFGEFIPAVRTYAMAKYIAEHNGKDNYPKPLEAFINSTSPDAEPGELCAMGWEPVMGLLKTLSHGVHTLKYNAEKPVLVRPGDSRENVLAQREAVQALVRKEKILPHLHKFFKDNGMADPACSDEEIRACLMEVMPDWEALTNAVMHDHRDGPKLVAAMKKKIHGETLSPADTEILAGKPELVKSWYNIMHNAGWGVAAAPCNQVYDGVRAVGEAWNEYITADLVAQAEEAAGNAFQAKAKRREAMTHHGEALTHLQLAIKTLKPASDRVENMLDYTNTHTLPDTVIDQVEKAMRTLVMPLENTAVDYARSRLHESYGAIQKRAPAAVQKIASDQCKRAITLVAMGGTLQSECDTMITDLTHIRQSAPDEQRNVSLQDPVYRKASHALRTMAHRLEMVQMSAEGLYADMSLITGKNEKGWKPLSAPDSEEAFVPPADSGKEIKEFAERLKRYCVALHQAATERRTMLMAATEQFYGGDKFDTALDVFQRIRKDMETMEASMQKRQALWNSQNSGVGSPA